jgi:hypothetical protein
VANVDPATGVYNKTFNTFALSGFIRAQVELSPLSVCSKALLTNAVVVRYIQADADEALNALVRAADSKE